MSNYRTEAFTRLDAAGFARTDAVYQRAQAATGRWLDTRFDRVDTAIDRQAVMLFLAELVHDSPSRTHTLARLRGAQAAFRWRERHLVIPSTRLVLDVLGGPGLTSAPFTAGLASRIRAGTANPVLAAVLALALVTGMEPLALATLPWTSLSPDNDVLHVSWTDPYRQLRIPDPALPQANALFHVPPAARALLAAARHFAQPSPDPRVAGRMFAAIPFSPGRIAAAAANATIPLRGQATDLAFTWQTRIGIAHAHGFGGPGDTRFIADQHFDPTGTRRSAAA